jgi:hypothetical protein
LINGDNETNAAKLSNQSTKGEDLTFNPHLHATLCNLSTTAAMNSLSGNANQLTQKNICDRIEYMVASWILMIQKSYECAIDLQLSLFAISKLFTCLNMKSMNNQINVDSLSELKYDVPLPIPSLPSILHSIKVEVFSPISRKRKKADTTTAEGRNTVDEKDSESHTPSTMFAGTYDVVPANSPTASSKKSIANMFKARGSLTDPDHHIIYELTSDEKLALFLRAVNGKGEKLLNYLIWIAQSCCHKIFSNTALQVELFHKTEPEDSGPNKSTTNRDNKKRKGTDGSRKMKNKRRKCDVDDVVSVSTTELSQTGPMCVFCRL